jgi:hypothetical protein
MSRLLFYTFERNNIDEKIFNVHLTLAFCSSQFNSLAIMLMIRGNASSAASTLRNERRVRRASISTAVRAYSFMA